MSQSDGTRLKIIGIEEHCWSPAIQDALLPLPYDLRGFDYTTETSQRLVDFGVRRIRDMQLMGIDQQILSVTTPATQVLDPEPAVRLAREANDLLAAAVKRDPAHFPAALATLPMPDPEAALVEFRRCVMSLGMRGAMIHGRTGDKFIDHPDFAPIMDAAGELGVPIFIHPQRPAKAISDYYYMQGLPEAVGHVFSSGGFGWHVETGINALRLVLSGTFERVSNLKIVLGHWGELLPFFLERFEAVFGDPSVTSIDVGRTFREHFYVAPSGLWSYPMFQHALAELGADHVLFAVDYPFQLPTDGKARRFLENAPISNDDKEKVGHRNLERLLGLR